LIGIPGRPDLQVATSVTVTMFTPCTHPTIRPFYAIGNSPAVNLTESLPQGVDADVLLLGCGDARHVLFTSYAELGLPERRKLDVTCCDIERNILGMIYQSSYREFVEIAED
jgi:hypothetical protein